MFKSKINFYSFKSIPVSYKILGVVCSVAVTFFGVYLFVWAGNIDSPAAPLSDTGRMYTLEQIYQKFYTGTSATKQSGGFTEPGSAPGSTMHTLDNIYGGFTTDATAANGTTSADVRAGKTFFATSGTTRGTSWGPVEGSIANCSTQGSNTCYAATGKWTSLTGSSNTNGAAGSLTVTIPQGYYSGTETATANDASNLVAGNIKKDAAIFGVNGSTKVLDTTAGTAADGDLLLNKVAFSDGATRTGSIANCSEGGNTCYAPSGYWTATAGSAVNVTNSAGTAIPAGYYSGTPKCSAALTGGSGANGAAAAGQILNGYYAYGSNGANINGSLATGSDVIVTSSTPTTIPADYYSGSQTCSAALTGGTGSVAATDQILSTYHAWNSTGAVLQGSVSTQTLNPANDTVNAGYYAATTLSSVDGDLAVGNIKSGTTIFGKLGTFKALLPTTAQVLCYDTDGLPAIACGGTDWPAQDADTIGDSSACTPTYTQGTYTVTDSCTNLEWQRYGHGSNNGYTVPAAAGDCTNGTYSASYCTYTWQNALKYCANLNNAQMGSGWRLPNVKELQSIANYSIYSPAIDAKFTNTKSYLYWSSTTYADLTTYAWYVYFYSGSVSYGGKTSGSYIRCVRQY